MNTLFPVRQRTGFPMSLESAKHSMTGPTSRLSGLRFDAPAGTAIDAPLFIDGGSARACGHGIMRTVEREEEPYLFNPYWKARY